MSISSVTPNQTNSGQNIYFGTAIPAASDAKGLNFNVGDIIINTNPTAGGALGWICIGAGSPGTWDTAGGQIDATASFPTNASCVTTSFFVTFATNYNIVSVVETHAVAGTDAGAVTLQIYADASGGAQGSGTAILSAALSMKTTANTPQQGAVVAGATLLGTQRLTAVFTGTTTALSGVLVKVYIQKTN